VDGLINMVDIKHLDKIMGLVITTVQQEIGTTIPINDPAEEKKLTEIPLALYFDSYNLFIYNAWSIVGPCENISEIIGEKIIDLYIENQDLNLRLSHSLVIKVDLSDNGFIGPESLVLNGPDNFCMVWT
jgi:hypothetical protein